MITQKTSEAGITLAEVMISLTILIISLTTIVAGFLHIQRTAIYSAYQTGAHRVMTMHYEQIMAMPGSQIQPATYIDYNYSGLRVTSTDSTNSQSAVTNQVYKNFNVGYTNWNNTQDAVLAYLTKVTVTTNYTTNIVSTTIPSTNLIRVANINISTFWTATGGYKSENDSKSWKTNTVSMIKPL